MLYNLNWSRTNRSRINVNTPHSLDSLIAWLETKDPAEHYDYSDTAYCLIAQWLQYCDKGWVKADIRGDLGSSFTYEKDGVIEDFQHLRPVANGHSGNSTFGDALRRARQLQEYYNC